MPLISRSAIGAIAMLASPVTAEDARGCFILARPLTQGEAIGSDLLAPVACRAEAPAATRYDPALGTPVAGQALAAGVYLGRLLIANVPTVAKGTALRLVVRNGAVRVERPVTALQPGRGARVFVRDGDGRVFAARIASGKAGR